MKGGIAYHPTQLIRGFIWKQTVDQGKVGGGLSLVRGEERRRITVPPQTGEDGMHRRLHEVPVGRVIDQLAIAPRPQIDGGAVVWAEIIQRVVLRGDAGERRPIYDPRAPLATHTRYRSGRARRTRRSSTAEPVFQFGPIPTALTTR